MHMLCFLKIFPHFHNSFSSFFMDVYLTQNIILTSGIQHSDLIYLWNILHMKLLWNRCALHYVLVTHLFYSY